MEVLNDLVGYENLKIYQNNDWFLFSLDSVLLPNFVDLKKDTKKIIDLGTGNAPIPLILSKKTSANIIGVEIQRDLYDLAVKSVKLNNLENQIEIINYDIRKLKEIYNSDTFDIITSNPPYFKYSESSTVNDDEHKIIARHEKLLNLDDLMKISKYLLKNNGIFAMVHRSERLAEIITIASQNNLQAKKIRFIYPKNNIKSNLVLIEFVKNGNIGLKVLPPLYVHNEDSSYTDEVLKMFE